MVSYVLGLHCWFPTETKKTNVIVCTSSQIQKENNSSHTDRKEKPTTNQLAFLELRRKVLCRNGRKREKRGKSSEKKRSEEEEEKEEEEEALPY